MLILICIVGGGLFGVVVTLGRGALAQNLSSPEVTSIQVTPSTIALGALITVRGTNFSPRTQVGLTRDNTIPINDTSNNSMIMANDKGSFTDTIIVEADWQSGPHIIRAEDALLHRSASFTILVTGHSPSLRPAHLLISTTTLDLGAGDQATNSIKTLTLTNAGGGQISWQTATTSPWLLLSPKNGTFSSGESVQVTVAADRSNLQPGSYTARAFFTSNAGQIALPVKMKTTQLEPDHLPVLQLTPAVLSFTGMDGGNNPPAQVVTVSNPGVLPFQWRTIISSGNGNWLSVAPPMGYVNKGSSQAAVISVNTSTLLPGRYYGAITFTGQGPGPVKDSPQNVYISLTVVPQCALQVSPGNLSFTQPSPPVKIISLNVTQGCTIPLQWSAVATTNNGGQWLSIGTISGTTPAYPAISVNGAGLAQGVYTGSILFSSTTGTQTLPVTFTMAQPTTPIMSTTPTSMAFSGVVGQTNLPAQTVMITNTGGGILNWQIAAGTSFGGDWLTATQSNGSLAAHQSASVNVEASLLIGLSPDTYTGTIIISGTDGSGQPAVGSSQDIPISLTVLPRCTIAVSTPVLSFAGVAGQPNSATKPVTVTANGTCIHPLNWTASSNSSWLSAMPSSGTVSLSASSTTNVGVTLAGLSPKTYTGTLTITAVDSVTHQLVGTPQNVTATLIVQPPCTLQAPSVTNEAFSNEAGSNPPAQSFTIGITGTCNGNITITPTTTKTWLIVIPSSATITGGSTTFTVKVTSATLPVGTDNSTISIAAVDSKGITITGSPQTVSVTERVLAPPSLTASSGGLTINVTTGTTSQPFSITNTGGEALNWTAALGAGAPAIASLSATAGTGLAAGASTAVNIIVNATGVAGGSTFTTSVIVSATDPLTGNVVAGSPATISLIINVALPSMQLSTNTLAYTTTVGVNPPAQSITLTNTGGNGLTWTAGTPSQPWLTLSLTNGNNTSNTTSTIAFNVNVTGMTSGTYAAAVVITPSVGSAVTVTVTLTVN
ncbi:MAG: hypothetical protein NVSMB33_12210 [Ktedonobacteraceae bacterium]